MKFFSGYILLICCFIFNIFCSDELDYIFQVIYEKMKLLPKGSTIYFAKNGKCSRDEYTPIFCLVDKSLYKVNATGYIRILDINNYNSKYFYELNIINKTYYSLSCIITYIYEQKEIKFLYYEINENNQAKFDTTTYDLGNKQQSINSYINCHGVLTSQLNCYFIDTKKFVKQIIFNFYSSIYSQDSDESFLLDIDLDFSNILPVASYLKDRVKIFICLNSTLNQNYQIYSKINFPNKRLRRMQGGEQINKFQEFNFNCDKNENLFIFSNINNNNCKNNINDNTKFFSVEHNTLSLFSNNNRSCIYENMKPQAKQIFLFNFSINYTKFDNNIIENTYKENKSSSIIVTTPSTYKNSLISQTLNIPTSFITEELKPSEEILEPSSYKNSHFSQTLNIPTSFITETSKLPIIDNTYIEVKNEEIIINKKLSITKEDILENIESIINDTKIGEIYEIEGKNLSILIYATNSSSLTNKTHISFEECEYSLKIYYNLSNNSIITFFQMELSNPNKQSLINQVEYQVYDENKNILDLSVCNNFNIKIFHGIKANSGLDMSILNSFKDTDINVFNISDEFFNDVCYPYSENGNDLILEDRIKDILYIR